MLGTTSLNSSRLLPGKSSPNLCLAHPTLSECRQIWAQSSAEWRDALSVSDFLEESEYLLTTPLAMEGNGTLWILIDRNEQPDQRRILSSCESFRKRSIFTDGENGATEGFVHGIASVFTNPEFRDRGYAGRMMRELAVVLRTWQVGAVSCFGSILYSDIGREYYAKFGWYSASENSHVEFPAENRSYPSSVRLLVAGDLADLCKTDEMLLRKRILGIQKSCFAVIPDHEHMLWHHAKEEFDCKKLFGKVPIAKGAVIGEPGARIWVIWTHRYYEDPDNSRGGNVLYILRLVVEDGEQEGLNDERKKMMREQLVALIRCAQKEAYGFRLSSVKLWNPPGFLLDLIKKIIPHTLKERQSDSIASLLWYSNGKDDTQQSLSWIANEKYAWC